MRKSIALLLSLSVLLNGIFITGAEEEPFFKDVPKDHWAYDDIMYFYKAGIVAGIGDDYFAPEDNVTREEFAKLLALTFSKTGETATVQTFSDVTPDMWSYHYVEAVKEFLTGYFPKDAPAFFNPEAKAVREDIAYALVKINGLAEKTELQDPEVLSKFSDADDISPALREYVALAVETGMLKGDDNNQLRPQDGITRAETVALLFRALKMPVDPDVTQSPSPTATANPTQEPTRTPTQRPTATPTQKPTQKPTAAPTAKPTAVPAKYDVSIRSSTIDSCSLMESAALEGTMEFTCPKGESDVEFSMRFRDAENGGGFVKIQLENVEELVLQPSVQLTGTFEYDDGESRFSAGIVSVDGDTLTLNLSEIDCKIVVKECADMSQCASIEPAVKPEPFPSQSQEEEIYWTEADHHNYVYSSALYGFNGRTGCVSGTFDARFNPEEGKARVQIEAYVQEENGEVNTYQIYSSEISEVSESLIKGNFHIRCNNELLEEDIAGTVTGIDGSILGKLQFATDDGSLKVDSYIEECSRHDL